MGITEDNVPDMISASLPLTAATTEIQHMVQTIVDRFAPQQVVVFGSYARGETKQDSDVDFLVVLDHVPN